MDVVNVPGVRRLPGGRHGAAHGGASHGATPRAGLRPRVGGQALEDRGLPAAPTSRSSWSPTTRDSGLLDLDALGAALDDTVAGVLPREPRPTSGLIESRGAQHRRARPRRRRAPDRGRRTPSRWASCSRPRPTERRHRRPATSSRWACTCSTAAGTAASSPSTTTAAGHGAAVAHLRPGARRPSRASTASVTWPTSARPSPCARKARSGWAPPPRCGASRPASTSRSWARRACVEIGEGIMARCRYAIERLAAIPGVRVPFATAAPLQGVRGRLQRDRDAASPTSTARCSSAASSAARTCRRSCPSSARRRSTASPKSTPRTTSTAWPAQLREVLR